MERLIATVAVGIIGLSVMALASGRYGPNPELSLPSVEQSPSTNSTDAQTSEPSVAPSDTEPPDLMDLALGTDLPRGIVPGRVRIPAIGVDAPTVELGYVSPTEIEVPATGHEAGWFTPSRQPGEIGPAIIAGHVDLNKAPGVFFRLRELTAGDEIIVTDDEGEARTFVVERLDQYPKDSLPDEVFGFGRAEPELRLITCGGVFDRSTGHYLDNIVVYATLKAPE